MKFRDLIKLVKSYGFKLTRIKGGHSIFSKNGKIISIPGRGHKNSELRKGTLFSILKVVII